MSSVLRLGVYRERIEKYGTSDHHHQHNNTQSQKASEIFKVTLTADQVKDLGLELDAKCNAGIVVSNVREEPKMDGRLHSGDRILFINGQDVRHATIAKANNLIQVSNYIK